MPSAKWKDIQSCPMDFIKFCKALSLASISAISLSGSTGSEALVTSVTSAPFKEESATDDAAAKFSFSADGTAVLAPARLSLDIGWEEVKESSLLDRGASVVVFPLLLCRNGFFREFR